MKIKSLLVGMMTCAALAACSNEDIVDNAGNQLEGDAYVAVNIVTPTSGSRALGDVEDGDAKENKVENAIFFFFDASGNGCADPAKPSLDFTNNAGEASTISKAVLILSNPTSFPASIVAVMNPTTQISNLGKISLTNLRTQVEGYSTDAKGSFVMSNSVYVGSNNSVVDVTPVSASNIGSTPTEAENNPVNIPVERVVAKVAANLNNKGTSGDFTVDGETQKIDVQLVGWKTSVLNPQSNLLKKVDASWTASWSGWNDATNFRSYWATSSVPSGYTYFTYEDIAQNLSAEYCLENTTSTSTKLIVAAKLTIGGKDVELMEWRGAKYTKEGMQTYLANTADVKQYYTKDGLNLTSLASKYIDFTTTGAVSSYKVIATLAGNTPDLFDATGNAVNKDIVNATLKALGEIKYWNGGASYYFTDIEHKGGEGLGSIGIVRNHSYKLTINSVTGLGTPVPDPDNKVIDPEKPVDDESYIAATVQVLKWKIVSQIVDLK